METLEKRKKLRLENYDYKSYGAYFLTVCTTDKKHILGKIVGGDAHIVPSESNPTLMIKCIWFGIMV